MTVSAMQLDAPNLVPVLFGIVGTAIIVGLPLLLGLLNYRRASRDRDKADIATVIGPLILGAIKAHNDEAYIHPLALSRYLTMENFNAALAALRSETKAEFNAIRDKIDTNEERRRDDMKQTRESFASLDKNVTRIHVQRREDAETA